MVTAYSHMDIRSSGGSSGKRGKVVGVLRCGDTVSSDIFDMSSRIFLSSADGPEIEGRKAGASGFMIVARGNNAECSCGCSKFKIQSRWLGKKIYGIWGDVEVCELDEFL